MSTDPFQARFTWFWLDDFELFHEAYDRTDARVEAAFRQGLTHLIIFGNHSRWNFRPWWKTINAGLAAIVRSAHKRGMKVIDHHSATLLAHPDTPQGIQRLYRNFEANHMDPKNYEGIVDYLLDPCLPSLPRIQLDGDWNPVVTNYGGYAHCYNNPDYRREYLAYLESVYATGVDGIMTDDVQYYGQSCNCSFCRQKFAERYHRELPGPGQWGAFFRRLDAPGGADHLRFRSESTHDFHVLVKEHYERLGLKMLRPNYCSAFLVRDWASTHVEELPALDWFFIECTKAGTFRYNWPYWMANHKYTVMQARDRGIPPMLMNYAKTASDLMVSFSMARLTGSLFTNTVVGGPGPDETALRAFERKHADWCFHANPLDALGVYFSTDSRDYGVGYEAGRLFPWMQALVIANVPYRLVNAKAPAIPPQCHVLLLVDIRMMSDAEVAKVRDAARDGRTVIVTGKCGDQRPDGTFRTDVEYRAQWCWSHADLPEDGFREFPCGRGKFIAVGDLFARPGDPQHWRDILADRHWLFSAQEPPYAYDAVFSSGLKRGMDTAKSPGRYFAIKPATDRLTALLAAQNPAPAFQADGLPDLVLCHAAERPGEGVVVHLANFAGTIDLPQGATIRRGDPLPWPRLHGTAALRFRRPLSRAILHFVDAPEITLAVAHDPATGYSAIALPLEHLHDYAMILAS